MPFAFGQRVNLSQQNDRTGITPIKWGYCADDPLTAGIASYNRGNGILTPTLMHIGTRGVDDGTACGDVAIPPTTAGGTTGFIYGSDACCIGYFSDIDGRTSGNNINSINDGSYTPPVFTEEVWRNVEVPPNAKAIKFYIQTKSGKPSDVIHATDSDCQSSSDCFVVSGSGACDECESYKNPPDPEDMACFGSGCQNDCACCAKKAKNGGAAGNYIVTVDLSGTTQETLYCYTAWFNGEGESENPATGNGATFASNLRCQDNIRVAIFPKLPGTPSYPYMDMSNPYAMVTTFKGGNIYEFLSDPLSHYTCSCSGGGGKGTECQTCDPDVCLPCSPCLPFPQGGDASINTFEKDSGISVNVEATGATAFWGPNGNDGLWNIVFGWNNDSNDGDTDFIYPNFGGSGGTACSVNGRFVDGGCGTGSATFDYDGATAGICSCTSTPDPGGQIIGYVVE